MSTGLGSLLVYTQPFINVALLISLLPLRSAVSLAVISCLVGAYMMGKKTIQSESGAGKGIEQKGYTALKATTTTLPSFSCHPWGLILAL